MNITKNQNKFYKNSGCNKMQQTDLNFIKKLLEKIDSNVEKMKDSILNLEKDNFTKIKKETYFSIEEIENLIK